MATTATQVSGNGHGREPQLDTEGLQPLLERATRGEKRLPTDRIARIGFQLVEWIVESNDGAICSQQYGSQLRSGVTAAGSRSCTNSLPDRPDFATTGTKPKRIRTHSTTEQRPGLMCALADSLWLHKQPAA